MGWCSTPVGWFLCFPTLLGSAGLMFVYGPILLLGAKLISISAELLIQVWPPTVVGGLLLPILNSGPLCALIVSASLKGTAEMAQESVRAGMGTVVGDTIMLLTFTWGGSVLLGRCDLDESSHAMDGVLTRVRSLVGTGVTAVGEVKSGAWVVASSILLFLIVQIPAASGYARDPRVLLGGSIAALTAAFLYTGYELALPRIERSGLMHRRKQRLLLHAAAESQQLGEGLSCKQAAEALFLRYDTNRDGSLSMDEITALVGGTARWTPGFVPRRVDVGLWLSLCKQNPEALSIPATAFVRALGAWIQSHKLDEHVKVPEGTRFTLNEEGRQLSVPLLDGEEDEEEGGRLQMSSSCSPEEGIVTNPLLKAGALLLLGFGLVAIFADPMVQTVGDFAAVTGIPAFYVSFVISPFASDASECLTSFFFAAKKKRASISLAFSQIYGAVIMTNTLCLSTLYAMVWYRGLSWDFSAEVAVCCLVCVAVGGLASRQSTFPTWTGLLALCGYPLSIAAIATLKNMGWH